jgi:hypothetical protein
MRNTTSYVLFLVQINKDIKINYILGLDIVADKVKEWEWQDVGPDVIILSITFTIAIIGLKNYLERMETGYLERKVWG